MTLQYHSLMLTTTAKQILDCTIRLNKSTASMWQFKKGTSSKSVKPKENIKKKNMKNSYNQ